MVSREIPLSRQTIQTDSDGGSERWAQGEDIKTTARYALCRCGQSRNKPFCDGSHTRTGFDGAETASRSPYLERAKELDGPQLTLSDAEDLCAFARFCDRRGTVWRQIFQSDDPATRAHLVEQAGACPSGRLVVWDKAPWKAVEPDLPASIGLVEDPAQGCSGPIWLRGSIEVVSEDGSVYERRNRVTLCRCGQSRNKPFCDGTHAEVKFQSGD